MLFIGCNNEIEEEPEIRSTTVQEIGEERTARYLTDEEIEEFNQDSKDILLEFDYCFENDCEYDHSNDFYNEYRDKWNDKLSDSININPKNADEIHTYNDMLGIWLMITSSESRDLEYVELFNEMAQKLGIEKRYVVE